MRARGNESWLLAESQDELNESLCGCYKKKKKPVSQSSEMRAVIISQGQALLFLQIIFSLIIVADSIYPSRGRHYEWFERRRSFPQLDLPDGWTRTCLSPDREAWRCSAEHTSPSVYVLSLAHGPSCPPCQPARNRPAHCGSSPGHGSRYHRKEFILVLPFIRVELLLSNCALLLSEAERAPAVC